MTGISILENIYLPAEWVMGSKTYGSSQNIYLIAFTLSENRQPFRRG
jgi:hypothetical protein